MLDATGACVAGLEAADLSLVVDGDLIDMAAIRLAGVVEACRGRGLFRDLMENALAWSDARSHAAILLYTEEPALYAQFGFVPLAQHAFVGAPPAAAAMAPARLLGFAEASEAVDRLAPSRAPLSNRCALRNGQGLLHDHLGEPGLRYAALEDALLVYEVAVDELVIVDIVAPSLPTMAEIVGALASDTPRVRTLFSPDRLGWAGTPELDDTGLMVRGDVPVAMTRPFMLPPTTSF